MAKHALFLVTYDRGRHGLTDKIQPYHWLYFIQLDVSDSKNLGIVHQLRGMPGAFYYPGPEDVDLSKPDTGTIKQELEIGEVDESKLERVHEILSQVAIESSESSGWNCQDWSLDGLGGLKKEGFVYDYLTREAVKNWLREEES